MFMHLLTNPTSKFDLQKVQGLTRELKEGEVCYLRTNIQKVNGLTRGLTESTMSYLGTRALPAHKPPVLKVTICDTGVCCRQGKI